MIDPITVPGTDKGDVLLYALSTCPMCKGVKKLLSEIGVTYRYIDVDLLDSDDRQAAKSKMKEWDRSGAFPLIVLNNAECIVGDEPEAIRKALS